MAENRLELYAWVGMDELSSGRIGLKQGLTPAGLIPLVAMDYHREKLERLKPQMEFQAEAYGKKIRLCRFVAMECVDVTEAGTE